jgi:dTDP-4-dehydrorhamnose 3,5-epimerase
LLIVTRHGGSVAKHFLKWLGIELSVDIHEQMWVPPGFAHGSVVMSDPADFLCKTTEYYAHKFSAASFGTILRSALIGPLAQNGIDTPLLSAKDRQGCSLYES